MRRKIEKIHKYKSGKVKIKSFFQLTDDQVTLIIGIINEVMEFGYYEPCYEITRRIFHELDVPAKKVAANYRPRSFIIKIT